MEKLLKRTGSKFAGSLAVNGESKSHHITGFPIDISGAPFVCQRYVNLQKNTGCLLLSQAAAGRWKCGPWRVLGAAAEFRPSPST
jgi:hypothetical protein